MLWVCADCGATNRVQEERLAEAVCGKCGQPLQGAKPVVLNDDSLPRFLATTEQPVLIDFWAEWCAPCRAMAPAFAQAAAQRPLVRFVKIDTDACQATAGQYGIRGIPTLVLFDRGREVARVSGAMPAGQLMRWLDSNLVQGRQGTA
jgi:thioredoxin 2